MTARYSILLLNPPYPKPIIRDNYCCFASKSYYFWPPVDLLYLSAILTHPEIKLSVIDAVAERLSNEQTIKKIVKIKPEVIISLTGTASFEKDLAFLKSVTELTGAKIFLMGNAPAFLPKYFLKNSPFVTGIIHNFFDKEILNFFLGEKITTQSISYRTNNKKFIIGKINFLPPNSQISIPNVPRYDLFPLHRYTTPVSRRRPLVTMLTSFGCPFTCRFCVGSALSYYPRPIREIKREFEAAKKAGVKEIFFEESTFNVNRNRVKKICQLLINQDYQFSWSANIHSLNLDFTTLKLMKKAGCHTLQIGVESGNQKILDKYAPSKNLETIKRAFRLARQAGIETLGYFIIGFPGETQEEAQKTINLAKELNPTLVSFSVLTPDYGTPLYSQAVKEKLINSKIISFDSSFGAVLRNPKFPKKLQDKMIKKAYFEFYLRPKKLLELTKDIHQLPIYFKNGISLISNFLA